MACVSPLVSLAGRTGSGFCTKMIPCRGRGGLTGMEQRKSPLVEPALPEAPGTERRIFASPDRSVLSRQSGVLQRRVGTHLA